MSEPNVEVVQRLFDLYATRGVEAALEVMDQGVEIVIPPELSAEPDSYQGHEGARRYFAGFEGMLEDVRFEALELIPEGEYVLARTRLGGRGASSGLEVDLDSVGVYTVRGGKITRVVPYVDLESARRALG